MSSSDLIATISAVIAALSLAVATFQFLETRRRGRDERDRLAAQEERLRVAVGVASAGAESADLIVQRAKDRDATKAELQNLARLLRGNLALLAEQLYAEGQAVAVLVGHQGFRSARFAEPDQRGGDAEEA